MQEMKTNTEAGASKLEEQKRIQRDLEKFAEKLKGLGVRF